MWVKVVCWSLFLLNSALGMEDLPVFTSGPVVTASPPILSDQLLTKIIKIAEQLQFQIEHQKKMDTKISQILRNQEKILTEQKSLKEYVLQKKQQTGVLEQHSENVKEYASFARSCKEVQQRGYKMSTIYVIQPKLSLRPFMVWCDMETKGGGWTYVLRRYNGSQDFYLDWDNYKNGFGNLVTEFWLGLEQLYQITGFELNEMLVELEDWDDQKAYALYNAFSIGSEDEGYSLKLLGEYSGNASDALRYSTGYKFSTKDNDQDSFSGNCATYYGGAWWYKECMYSHLTGNYLKGEVTKDLEGRLMFWDGFRGNTYGLKKAKMMVRPRN